MDYENIKGFVARDYDCKWWVGCVLSAEKETDTVKIMLSSSQRIDSSTYKLTVCYASTDIRHIIFSTF
jgi:hypothetical protein